LKLGRASDATLIDIVMANPLVSICLPNYNYAHYLRECISSCLSQSYEPLEIIITDNASTDNSLEVISSFDDPRVRFAENHANLGLVGNLNRALSLARGDIVKFVCADDLLERNAVELMAAALADPEVSLVYSSAKITDAEGKHTRTHRPYPESGRLPGREEARRLLTGGNHVGAPTAVALRASTLREVGPFDERLRFQVDQEMWVRVLLTGDAYYFSEPLVSTREHDGSETRRLEQTRQIEFETIKFINSCLQNEQIRSLLSESEVRELTERCKSLSMPRPVVDAGSGSRWGRYKTHAGEALKARLPPYLIEALRPAYRKLVGAYQKIQGVKG
jgi:GT2 family glycosyltransferase